MGAQQIVRRYGDARLEQELSFARGFGRIGMDLGWLAALEVEAARRAVDAAECDCPKSDLEIGGRGHLADCDTATARAAFRSAERMANEVSAERAPEGAVMEGALFIGEDLDLLRRSLAAAEEEAAAMKRTIEKLADDLGVCLTHSTLRRECGCVEEE